MDKNMFDELLNEDGTMKDELAMFLFKFGTVTLFTAIFATAIWS